MTSAGSGPTINAMRIATVLVGALISACSLYGGDDEPAELDAGAVVDAPAAASFAGTWTVGWTCESAACPDAGYSAIGTVIITEQPGRVTLRWNEAGVDVGQRGERDLCAAFPDVNGKSEYTLCFVQTDPPDRADARITWGESTWHAFLMRQ